MTIGFSAKNEIINSTSLYGRKDIFSQLCSLANRRQTVSITGLRRFGKTSILHCLESELRSSDSSTVYPIYFDFKEVGSIVRGTTNVYRYMVSRFVERLYNDKHFTKEEIFKKKLISPSNDWEDVYDNLADVNPVRMQSVFEEIVSFFSEYLGKTILFLIDEYEYLFKYSFDDPVGFMKMRNFASKINDININPFSFFVAGAITWENLCTITGSGEMNCIDESIYLPPIDYNSFVKMWENEIKLVDNCSTDVINGGDFAYMASGGVPFYGKLIGSNWISTSKKPDYFILKSYFQEILSALQFEEKEILIELSKISRNFKNSKYVLELVQKGLIVKRGNSFELTVTFLKDYIKAMFIDLPLKETEIAQSQILTDSIFKLIMTINNTHKAKRGIYVFEPVNDDAALINDLRCQCNSSEQFSDFASSLYKIIFERTKDNINGTDYCLKRLPKPYKKGHEFIEIVDILRHSLGGGHLMDTFTQRPGQMTKSKMLKILTGSVNEPNTSLEFYELQIVILKRFEAELNNINTIVRSLT